MISSPDNQPKDDDPERTEASEVFDQIDKTADAITDAEVDEHLRQLLAQVDEHLRQRLAQASCPPEKIDSPTDRPYPFLPVQRIPADLRWFCCSYCHGTFAGGPLTKQTAQEEVCARSAHEALCDSRPPGTPLDHRERVALKTEMDRLRADADRREERAWHRGWDGAHKRYNPASPSHQCMYSRRYDAASKALDELLGPNEEDGCGQGLVAEIYHLAKRCEHFEGEPA